MKRYVAYVQLMSGAVLTCICDTADAAWTLAESVMAALDDGDACWVEEA